MKVVVFAATKGGTGKTTLCYNVALEAAKKHQVLVGDLDPQKSLKTMWEKRGELLNPRLVSNITSLGESVRLLAQAGYDREFIFVDTPGSMMPIIKDAIGAADLVVLPTGPSPLDWAAQEAVADLVESMGLKDKTMFVVNKAEGKSDMVARTKQFFEMRTALPMPIIKQRAEYARAAESGKGGIETNKDAAAEIRQLWAAIQTALKNQQTSTTKEASNVQQLH